LAVLLATAVVNTPWAARSESGDVDASAREFVGLLAKADFAGAVGRFNAAMKQALPEARLREAWAGVQAQAGPFKKQLNTRAEKVPGYDVVLVTCQFEKATLDTKVVFNTNSQVAGLFFVPTRPATSPPPAYARSDAFREKEFKVGKGQWVLPGTLAVPAGGGPWPAVVLVHGSGPQDRDETVLANKPFRDLAWGLASRGVAVLRYEKRTKQYGAKIVAAIQEITLKEETIDDALDAAARLRATEGIDAKRVFVLGHSLGGMAIPRIGKADPEIAGLIVLAGSTRPLEDIIVDQLDYLASLDTSKTAEGSAKVAQIRAEVAKVKKLTAADVCSTNLLVGGPARYWLDLRDHDTLAIAKGLKQPLLILQGQRDYQVTQADFDGWKKALGAAPNATFKLYPTLNHLFIAGEGKSTPGEYEQSGHVAETVVADIAAWIEAH
jgi:dienelactone hydrolase